jgi:hypothetical protein
LRTKYTQFGRRGPKKRIEKFSAMGNAFTFELETLLFYAIAKAVAEVEGVVDSRVVVYGDDIVCSSESYDKTIYALNYFGFRVNETKSFQFGPFFESCGKHYHSGVDVTPIYQKSVVNSPEECIRFHNRLVRWSERIHGDPWMFEAALTTLIALYQDLSWKDKNKSAKRLPRIPVDAEGDDGFLSPEEFFERDCNGGFTTFVYRMRQKKTSRLNNASYLQLKLNDFKTQNGDPRGFPSEPYGRGRYRLSRAYFYR